MTYRCPACGQPLDEPSPAQCPLCGFKFSDARATGVDVTPYAKAVAQHQPGWYAMSEWVWFAGWGRLKHLALMCSSAASARFARRSILLMSLGLGVLQATRQGWRWVTSSPALDPAFEPGGIGWLHVAATPEGVRSTLAPEVPVDLWWNPIQGAVAVVTGFFGALLLMWLAVALTRAGVTRAHEPTYREDRRMSAAIHYGTSWGVLFFVAALVAALRPIAYLGAVGRWPWYPPQHSFELAAAVVAGVGVVLWWFWLLRLGATAPASTRGRVVAFFAVGVPVIVCAAGCGWYFGLDQLYKPVFTALGVAF
jgi:hypothetical protein